MRCPKLIKAEALPDFFLLLDFSGELKLYDFKQNLDHKYFRQLADKRLFAKVSVHDGEIEWATGQDFCPHTLYENSEPFEEDSLLYSNSQY